jgi:AcrR family transcriptional regulator
VSKGVISYYFAGKDDLLREVVEVVLNEAGDYMRPRVQSAGSYLESIRTYIESNLEFIATHRTEIMALIEIFNGAPPGRDVAPPYAEGHRTAVDAVAKLLRDGQRAGEFGSFSPQFIAVALRASIDAVSELLRADPTMDGRAYGVELADLFVRGVQA